MLCYSQACQLRVWRRTFSHPRLQLSHTYYTLFSERLNAPRKSGWKRTHDTHVAPKTAFKSWCQLISSSQNLTPSDGVYAQDEICRMTPWWKYKRKYWYSWKQKRSEAKSEDEWCQQTNSLSKSFLVSFLFRLSFCWSKFPTMTGRCIKIQNGRERAWNFPPHLPHHPTPSRRTRTRKSKHRQHTIIYSTSSSIPTKEVTDLLPA